MRHFVVVFALLVFAAPVAASSEELPVLFKAQEAEFGSAFDASLGAMAPAVLSRRAVKVSAVAIELEEFSIELEGVRHRCTRSAREGRWGEASAVRGKVEGSEATSILTYFRGFVSGMIYPPGGEVAYLLSPEGERQFLTALDMTRVAGSSCGLVEHATRRVAGEAKKIIARANPSPEGIYRVDVAEWYDLSAYSRAGGEGQIGATIRNAVDITNTVFRDSGARAELRLVRSGLFNTPSTGDSSADFRAFYTSEEVERKRAEVKADLVGLWGDTPDGFSRAFRPGIQFVPEFGYHFVQTIWGVGNLSYPHEVGHNLGADHNSQDALPATRDPHPYARGWCDNTVRTVMSYSSSCSGPRIPRFSSPALLWEGRPIGSADANNVRMLNEAVPAVAGYFTATDDPTCISSATTLCLGGDRFKVEAAWKTGDGNAGQAQVVRLTEDTGYLWFFASTNVEAVVKVLDACGLNSRYWVFAGGLTNVEVTLTVTDTVSGEVWTRVNPQGTAFQPIQDTGAFVTCP